MYTKKQQGKGLFNFMAGSVVALGAIAAVLFTLNKNSARDFKQPQLVGQPNNAPQVLTPSNANSGSAPIAQAQPASIAPPPTQATTPPVNDVAVMGDNEPIVQAASETNTARVNPRPVQPAPNVVASPPDVAMAPAKPPRTQTAPNKVEADPVLGGVAANSNRQPARVAQDAVKPTAEQILDSGNIQKAREVARREATAKAMPVADKGTTTAKSGRASVQAGAFNNRQAADEQRAKLALMGVQTQIVPVQSNGKTMYRVQTGTLDGARAAQVQQKLQSQGVNAFTRNQ